MEDNRRKKENENTINFIDSPVYYKDPLDFLKAMKEKESHELLRKLKDLKETIKQDQTKKHM